MAWLGVDVSMRRPPPRSNPAARDARLVPSVVGALTTCQPVDGKGAKYTVYELDKEADGPALRSELGAKVDRTSVPAIWIDGAFIGGCNDGPMGGINTLEREGQLDGMLAAAGAV